MTPVYLPRSIAVLSVATVFIYATAACLGVSVADHRLILIRLPKDGTCINFRGSFARPILLSWARISAP